MRDPLERMRLSFGELLPDMRDDLIPGWLADDENSFPAQLNLGETSDTLKVTIDVPGFNRDDIDISIDDHALVVKGEREETDEEEKQDYHRFERHYGSFERRVTLPCDIDSQSVAADLDKGVLTITLPKSQSTKESRRTIPISAH